MDNQSPLSQSSFIIQPYRRKYLKEYFHRMSQDNLGTLMDDNVADVLKEQGFSITESPRSVYKVAKLYEALAKYEPKDAPVVDLKDEHIQAGVNLAYACFAHPVNEPVLTVPAFSPELVYKITSNHKGSAGLTAWGQTKAESYVRAYERGLQQMRGEKAPEPCIAFKRTQFNDKTRLVWGYPYAMTAIEGLFARPLIEKFKTGITPMAFGMPTGVLGAKLRVSSYHKRFAYSTDVSSFDASIPRALIDKAFKILSTWFDLTQIEPTSGVRLDDIWYRMVKYFITTPIVMPDGNCYFGKRHGVPSGSYFTQMIDSVVNVILVGAIGHKFNLFINKDDILVLGDDVLFWSNRFVPLHKIATFATKLFSMKFNASKSAVFRYDETLHYLGRDWTNGVPSLSEDEILIRMSQPETFRKYPVVEEERRRQARILIMSYAAVYYDAFRIHMKTLGPRTRYSVGNASFERYVYGDGTVGVNPEYLSGLQRYRMKYIDQSLGGTNVPLALQFWK